MWKAWRGWCASSGHDTLLVVDAITGLGTTRFDVDGWGIDVIIGGSQKAVMVPPGLAYCAVSQRAWSRMESAKSPRYYFDLRKERKAGAKGESAFTPAIALVAALAAALDYIREAGAGDLAAGREALIANAEICAEMTRAGARALGLKLFASVPSNALTAIAAPEGMDSGVIVKVFRENFGAVVAAGQGDVMKSALFRIAHLGYYDYLDTIGIIAALEQVMARIRPVEFGAAVAAAQKVYAEQGALVEAGYGHRLRVAFDHSRPSFPCSVNGKSYEDRSCGKNLCFGHRDPAGRKALEHRHPGPA